MFNLFSCTYWPFVQIWRNVYASPLPILKLSSPYPFFLCFFLQRRNKLWLKMLETVCFSLLSLYNSTLLACSEPDCYWSVLKFLLFIQRDNSTCHLCNQEQYNTPKICGLYHQAALESWKFKQTDLVQFLVEDLLSGDTGCLTGFWNFLGSSSVKRLPTM